VSAPRGAQCLKAKKKRVWKAKNKEGKMYRSYDDVNGIGPTVFRSPSEIREDIGYIKRKIKETNAAMNIREILTTVLANEDGDCERLISVIAEAVEEASRALDELRSLEDELCELEDELREVKWIMGA
jgi:hypothetical protein